MLLEEIGGRLLSIVRCPDGIGGQHFFQKHARAGFGEAVRDYRLVENDGDEASYFYVDDVEGLMTLVQMNAIEFHPWGSRVDAIERPDRIVFDLDPDPEVPWERVVEATGEVRDRLEALGALGLPAPLRRLVLAFAALGVLGFFLDAATSQIYTSI